jgi:hypothetical protein
MLAICFASLNARLQLPPFSLFLIALTLTDGQCDLKTCSYCSMLTCVFVCVSDDCDVLFPSNRYRNVVFLCRLDPSDGGTKFVFE